MDDKQKAFFEKARRGVLKHLQEKGGRLPLAELHDYSMNKFLIQHQRFSEMMETFVNEKLVAYDFAADIAQLTDQGREFLSHE